MTNLAKFQVAMTFTLVQEGTFWQVKILTFIIKVFANRVIGVRDLTYVTGSMISKHMMNTSQDQRSQSICTTGIKLTQACCSILGRFFTKANLFG